MFNSIKRNVYTAKYLGSDDIYLDHHLKIFPDRKYLDQFSNNVDHKLNNKIELLFVHLYIIEILF